MLTESLKSLGALLSSCFWMPHDLRPATTPPQGRAQSNLLCSQILDRRRLEFAASITATGWLRHRERKGRSVLSDRAVRSDLVVVST